MSRPRTTYGSRAATPVRPTEQGGWKVGKPEYPAEQLFQKAYDLERLLQWDAAGATRPEQKRAVAGRYSLLAGRYREAAAAAVGPDQRRLNTEAKNKAGKMAKAAAAYWGMADRQTSTEFLVESLRRSTQMLQRPLY
jgi:Ni,Fe-hydrogenase I large subunit